MFETANYAEAVLWAVIGLIFALCAVGRPKGERVTCSVTAVTFLLFGVSDVVEVQTGGWWKPWWLFVWKGGCVVILVLLFVRHWKGKRNARD